ncbi:hypothetical protein OF83DRAFT_1169430 [Amylostereum chailletii]|nr:hypothetical protein OF83DRAFT_1169430 [Amylostereum chailletii]
MLTENAAEAAESTGSVKKGPHKCKGKEPLAGTMDKEAIETLAAVAGRLIIHQARADIVNYEKIAEGRKLELKIKQAEQATAEAYVKGLKLQIKIDRDKRKALRREWKAQVQVQEGMVVD